MKKQIGKYRLLKELGRGGMGEVYLAKDTEIGEKIALKILPPELTRSPQYVERFRREASAVSRLDHPHIIKVYEVGEDEGMHFIAMEYLGGAPLSSLIQKRGSLPIPDAAKIIIDVAEALDFAHSSGVIHRDIKPDNILSDEKGEFKVMDFGIARMEEGTQLTVTGTIMGTPEYMSPEQASGRKVDQRTDIYSLGIVFYEMLTGKVPFHAETALEVIQMHIARAPESPRAHNPEIPGNVAAIIDKMVEKKPADRYASFRHMINALARAVPKAATVAPRAVAGPVKPGKARPEDKAGTRVRERVVLQVPTSVRIALVLSIALNIGLFALFLFRPTARPEEPMRPSFTIGGQIIAPPTMGGKTMYIGAQDGTLYACNLHTGIVDWMFETGGQITAAPVVDGDRVYVGSWDKHLYALDSSAGGMLIWKVNVGDIISAAPTLSDGTLFVTTRTGAVYALDPETGARKWEDNAGGNGNLSPSAHGGVLFIDGKRSLLAYDAAGGRRLGGFAVARMKTSPVRVGDRFYYVRYDDEAGVDELRAFEVQSDLSQNRLRWIHPEWSIPLTHDYIE